MPVVIVGRGKKKKYRIETNEERNLIDKVLDDYRNRGNDVQSFLKELLGINSYSPSLCLSQIKNGNNCISIDSYRKLTEYTPNRK